MPKLSQENFGMVYESGQKISPGAPDGTPGHPSSSALSRLITPYYEEAVFILLFPDKRKPEVADPGVSQSAAWSFKRLESPRVVSEYF
jgi:hypothetical protein